MQKTVLTVWMMLAGMTLAGCSWFSKENDSYQSSEEHSELQIPDGMDAPQTRGALAIPEVVRGTGNITAAPPYVNSSTRNASAQQLANRGGTATEGYANLDDPMAERVRVVRVDGGLQMQVQDSLSSTWRRITTALNRSTDLRLEEIVDEGATLTVHFTDRVAQEARPGLFSRMVLRRKGPEDLSGVYTLTFESRTNEDTLVKATQEGAELENFLAERIYAPLVTRLQ